MHRQLLTGRQQLEQGAMPLTALFIDALQLQTVLLRQLQHAGLGVAFIHVGHRLPRRPRPAEGVGLRLQLGLHPLHLLQLLMQLCTLLCLFACQLGLMPPGLPGLRGPKSTAHCAQTQADKTQQQGLGRQWPGVPDMPMGAPLRPR